VGRGVDVGSGVEVGLGPGVILEVGVAAGAGCTWQAVSARKINSQIVVLIDCMLKFILDDSWRVNGASIRFVFFLGFGA